MNYTQQKITAYYLLISVAFTLLCLYFNRYGADRDAPIVLFIFWTTVLCKPREVSRKRWNDMSGNEQLQALFVSGLVIAAVVVLGTDACRRLFTSIPVLVLAWLLHTTKQFELWRGDIKAAEDLRITQN